MQKTSYSEHYAITLAIRISTMMAVVWRVTFLQGDGVASGSKIADQCFSLTFATPLQDTPFF